LLSALELQRAVTLLVEVIFVIRHLSRGMVEAKMALAGILWGMAGVAAAVRRPVGVVVVAAAQGVTVGAAATVLSVINHLPLEVAAVAAVGAHMVVAVVLEF